MPPKRTTKSANDKLSSKKAKSSSSASTRTITDALLGSEERRQESLVIKYKGQRILLTASAIYGGKSKVPRGEEDFLFQYTVADVNDETYATIEYEGKYIIEGGREWKSFLALQDSDFNVEGYRFCCFKEDHALFNKYLGIVNKRINDCRDAERKREEESKQKEMDDVSDIQRKIVEEGMEPYDVLLAEFEPAGELLHHTVQKGEEAGKVTQKQHWSE